MKLRQFLLLLGLFTAACAGNAVTGNLKKDSKIENRTIYFRVEAHFKDEKKGDGFPTIQYSYYFKNLGSRDIYISTYNSPFAIRSIEPRSLFEVKPIVPHPTRFSAPEKKDFIFVKANSEAVFKNEAWVGEFVLDQGSAANATESLYSLKKPGKVRLKICYSPKAIDPALAPKDAPLWTEEVCDPNFVEIEIKALGTEAKR